MNKKKEENYIKADEKSSDFVKRFVDFKNGSEVFQPVININMTTTNYQLGTEL